MQVGTIGYTTKIQRYHSERETLLFLRIEAGRCGEQSELPRGKRIEFPELSFHFVL